MEHLKTSILHNITIESHDYRERREAKKELYRRAHSILGYWPRSTKEVYLVLDLIEPSLP